MIFRRSAGVLACLAFAGAALASGLGRLEHGRLERGRSALAAGDAPAALAAGTQAVRAAPLDPAATALLGAARLASGDRAGGEAALRLAARLGWRVPAVQLYWYGRALELGDPAAAAVRFDALLRQEPGLLDRMPLANGLEGTAQGRAALLARLATRPPWAGAYARTGAHLPGAALAQRAQVLLAASPPLGCAAIGPVADRLEPAAGLALWQAQCPEAERVALTLAPPPSQFAWRTVGHADIGLAMAGTHLRIESTAPVTRRVLTQRVLLPAGHYRASWRGSDPAGLMRVALACTAEPQRWNQGIRTGQGWRAEVDHAGCPAPWLSFAIAPGGVAQVGAIRLER